MRIHTDSLAIADLLAAQQRAGDGVTCKAEQRGSQKRDAAWEVKLYGTSTRRPNDRGAWRADGDVHAATWDEWGMFLAELFRRAPNATEPGVYESAEHFHWATDERFQTLMPADQHGGTGHKWQYAGGAGAADNSYSIHMCQGCDAERRVGGWGA